jgi:enolase-phosphatase E1
MEARAILLDIEGTTTPVSFVYETLFPFARRRLRSYLSEHWEREDIRADVARSRAEGEIDSLDDLDSAVAGFERLMDEDRKSTALKSLQGKIWEEGYRTGELKGEVYADVPPAFERWRAEGRTLAIFSSGSVLAQKLIFGHTNYGDLTGYLSAYFDTTTGPKRVAESYRRIAMTLGFEPDHILFYSDVVAELDAAREAGMQTALCVREGEGPAQANHQVTRKF